MQSPHLDSYLLCIQLSQKCYCQRLVLSIFFSFLILIELVILCIRDLYPLMLVILFKKQNVVAQYSVSHIQSYDLYCFWDDVDLASSVWIDYFWHKPNAFCHNQVAMYIVNNNVS